MNYQLTQKDFTKVSKGEIENLGYLKYNELLEFMYDEFYDIQFNILRDKIDKYSTINAHYIIDEVYKPTNDYDINGNPFNYKRITIKFNENKNEVVKEIMKYTLYYEGDDQSYKYPKRMLKFIFSKKYGSNKNGRPKTKILIPRRTPILKPLKEVPNKVGRPSKVITTEQLLRTKLLKKILDCKKKHNLILPVKEDYINKTNDELEKLCIEIKPNKIEVI